MFASPSGSSSTRFTRPRPVGDVFDLPPDLGVFAAVDREKDDFFADPDSFPEAFLPRAFSPGVTGLYGRRVAGEAPARSAPTLSLRPVGERASADATARGELAGVTLVDLAAALPLGLLGVLNAVPPFLLTIFAAALTVRSPPPPP
jgi:hypothetical protein